MFLPRQFQVAVVENVDERTCDKAIWLFPLYMLAINIFVLPIAFGGLLRLPAGGVDADTFVLTLPMAQQQEALALLVFIGGLSAATGMVIVETIALSTMVCNDLVMPVLLRCGAAARRARATSPAAARHPPRRDRRASCCSATSTSALAGEAYALVSIGLISFAAVAQFAPAVLGGIYWKGGTRAGALAGLSAASRSGSTRCCCPRSRSPAGSPIELPRAARSASRCSSRTRCSASPASTRSRTAMIWSMLANIGAYVGVSLAARQSVDEHQPGDAVRRRLPPQAGEARRAFWRGTRSAPSCCRCSARFLGPERAAARSSATTRARARRRGSLDELAADARARALRREPARRRHRRRLGARHGRLGRAGGAARHRRGDDDPRRGLAGASPTATSSSRSRASWRRPPPSCAPPTSGCRSSTG